LYPPSLKREREIRDQRRKRRGFDCYHREIGGGSFVFASIRDRNREIDREIDSEIDLGIGIGYWPFGELGVEENDVRTSASDDGCESEYGVVHVSRGLDDLHPNPLLRLAPRSLHFQLFPWHGLDHRPPRPFLRNVSFLPLEEGDAVWG